MARGAATPIPRRAGARTPIVEAMAVILGKDAAQFRVSFVPQLIGMMLSPDPTWWYRHERQAPTPGQPPPPSCLPLATRDHGGGAGPTSTFLRPPRRLGGRVLLSGDTEPTHNHIWWSWWWSWWWYRSWSDKDGVSLGEEDGAAEGGGGVDTSTTHVTTTTTTSCSVEAEPPLPLAKTRRSHRVARVPPPDKPQRMSDVAHPVHVGGYLR